MPAKFVNRKSGEIRSENLPTATYLVIVESPSKCPKIEHFLGKDYACISSKGHIRALDGLKSIDTQSTFMPTYSMLIDKKEHVEKMREIISRFSKDCVFLASDDDREGEAIAWHICQVFGLPVETTPRIVFHEITSAAVRNAIQSPGKINMALVHAQQARQVLDILVGYKVSPYLWKYLYNNKSNSLSAGRCQTPALRLVYENDKELSSEKLECKYKTTGTFTSRNIKFFLNHEFMEQQKVVEFLELSKTFSSKLSIGSPTFSKRSPPKPFSTSRLLQTASNILHMSPAETMSICQSLYQNGHITYMRTESSKYAKPFLEQVGKFIETTWESSKFVGNLDALENKNSTDPHESIRVTHLEVTHLPVDEKTARLASLYRLIWKNTVESCMSDFTYDAYDISISAPLDYCYVLTLEIPLFLGWKKVGAKDAESLPIVETGLLHYFQTLIANPLICKTIESTVVVRNKHSHYTEASLIQTLEDLGIGRPSTFASLVETILERGYVKKCDVQGKELQCKEFKLEEGVLTTTIQTRTFGNEKKKLVLQPLGKMAIEYLVQHFEPLFNYTYTKRMEDELDAVSSGKTTDWANVCRACDLEIQTLSHTANSTKKQAFSIEPGYDFMFEKFGPVIRHTLEDGNVEFLPAKKELNYEIEKLKAGGYTLGEVLEIKSRFLGKYENQELYLKTGRYGPYVEWGEKKESIKSLQKPIDEVGIEDILAFLENKAKGETMNILRVLNPYMSVRKGKFGAYVFFQKPGMKTPKFLNIKKFPEGFLGCDPATLVKWCCDTYQITI